MNWKIRLLNAIGPLLNWIGFNYPNLSIDVLKKEAIRLTGYNDFGNNEFNDGLNQLLSSAKKEANLTTLGKFSLRHEIINLLCSRLSLYHELKENPTTFNSPIKAPLIIAGLPRTGTSILQNLLALDPQFRTPLVWEYNLAPEPPAKKGNEKRINRAKENIENFKKLIPSIDSMHPIEADLPQECIMATAINFDSILFELKYGISSYQKWYRNSNKLTTYKEHKMVLQYLQKNIPTQKWLLKTPAHLSEFPTLLEIYPDAMIIQTHRDVNNVIPSLANLYHQVRVAFCDKIDKNKIGREMISIWSERLNKGLDFRDQNQKKEDQFFDLDFADLMKEPMDSIKKIYQYFELPLTDNTLKKMREFLIQNSRNKKGKHSYSIEGFGLTKEEINTSFKTYSKRFISLEKNYT